MNAKEHTTISFRGNRQDVRLLNVLAASRGVRIGELVRNAVDTVYGEDLRRCAEFFVESSEMQNSHTRCENDKRKPTLVKKATGND